MIKTLTDVKRIRGQIEANNLHHQYVFKVVDDRLGNFIVRKKGFREKTMLTMFVKKKPECFRLVEFFSLIKCVVE